jgi:hypothetical protein
MSDPSFPEFRGVPLLPRRPGEPEGPAAPDPDIAMVFRPRNSSVPVHIRERRLRKYALRACGFECLGSTGVAPREKR